MASYHCTVKAGGKGMAGPHDAYIEREGKYAPERTRGKSRLEDLEYKSSGNMPVWAEQSAGIFWRAADLHERANGATYREIEIALPRELNPSLRRALIEDFIQQQLGDRHAYTYAIHIPKAAIEKGEQPHCHLMYSERTRDGIERDPEQYFKRANTKNPEKGGCKKDSAGTKERLLATRELWAKVQNQHLEQAGFSERVTHLSLKAQGIDRDPEKHLGPSRSKDMDAGAVFEKRIADRELDLARKEVSELNVSALLAAEIASAALANQLKEQEDDRIRNETLDGFDRNIKAASRSGATVDTFHGVKLRDYARLDEAIRATDGNIQRARVAAERNGKDLDRAVDGAQQRVAERGRRRGVEATRNHVERVSRILQQVADRLSNVVSAIARAAHEIARQVAAQLERRRQAAIDAEAAKKARSAPGINLNSRYHPDNIAKREAQEKEAATKGAIQAESQKKRDDPVVSIQPAQEAVPQKLTGTALPGVPFKKLPGTPWPKLTEPEFKELAARSDSPEGFIEAAYDVLVMFLDVSEAASKHALYPIQMKTLLERLLRDHRPPQLAVPLLPEPVWSLALDPDPTQQALEKSFLAQYPTLPVVEVSQLDGRRLDAACGRLGVFSARVHGGGRISELCKIPSDNAMPDIGQVFDKRAVPGQSKKGIGR